MNRLSQLSLFVLSTYICVVVFLSILLTNERFYMYILNTYIEPQSSLEIRNIHWHPINPSLKITDLRIGEGGKIIDANEVALSFSLLNLFTGKVISSASFFEVTARNQFIENGQIVDLNIFKYLNFVDVLNINKLKLISSQGQEIVEIDLTSKFNEQGHFVVAKFKDKNANTLNLNIKPNSALKNNISEGMLSSKSFNLDESLLNSYCAGCKFNLLLDSQVSFTLLEDKLLNLKGNLKLTPQKKFLGVESISTSFVMKDTDSFTIQFSPLINDGREHKFPNFFLLGQDRKLVIPELFIYENDIVNNFVQNIHPTISLEGELSNISLDLNSKTNLIQSTFNQLRFSNDSVKLSGLSGKLLYSNEVGKILLRSPLLKVKSNIFEAQLGFDNLVSEINFDIQNGRISILPSHISSIYNGQELEGQFKLTPTPTSILGNFDLRLHAKEISSLSSHQLFPRTPALKNIQSSLEKMITCGNFTNLNMIYRGLLDSRSDLNTSTVSLEGSGKDLCFEFNEYKVDKANSFFSVNDYILRGEIEGGNFLDSQVNSSFETYKSGNEYRFQIQGNLEGPFSTLTELTFANLRDFTVDGGKHFTQFEFDSSLSKGISLLKEDSELRISTESKRGSLDFHSFGLDLNNIYIKAEYDSAVGFENGIISFKLNSNPVVLELSEKQTNKGLTSFISKDKIRFQDLLPQNLQSDIKGISDAKLELNISSFQRGLKYIESPSIDLYSNLKGTEIKISDPFLKPASEIIDLQISFSPFYKDNKSQVKFSYGDLLRGKLHFYKKNIEGFLIAGKEKQSISVESGIVSLIGNIEKLDYALFNNLDPRFNDSPINFQVKRLTVEELNFSNYIFKDNLITSSYKDDLFELHILNNELGGKISIPLMEEDTIAIDLNFININNIDNNYGSRSAFLNLYNELSFEMIFRTKSIVYNSRDYGSWSFTLTKDDQSLIMDNLMGIYGKWGLTYNADEVSRLIISREGLGWKTSLDSRAYSGSPEKAFKQIGIEPNFEMDTFSMDVSVNWPSLPWEVDYGNIIGDVDLNIKGLVIKNREELQAQNNLLRIVNIFNITDSFEKITNLDFRKLYKTGFSADSVNGVINISRNDLNIKSPLVFKSGSSEFSWKGNILRDEKVLLKELNLEVVMTLPLRDYLPAYAFLLGGPITAGIVYIAGKAFERNLDQLSSGSWSITGTLEEPVTNFNGWFESTRE